MGTTKPPVQDGPIKKEIIARLTAKYAPEVLHVKDMSHKHAGHEGANHPEGETHFQVQIVSKAFYGQTRVARQRELGKALADLLKNRVHALQLHTFTPEEYAKRH